MGNSEVGHLNLGAGRIVYQDIMRINLAIEDGSLAGNPVLSEFIAEVASRKGTVHLMGLVSDGGVHSMQTHAEALLRIFRDAGIGKTAVHAFLDGRDTPPTSGRGYVADLQKFMDDIGYGTMATVSGRYYAMDRDRRWERTELAYDAVTSGIGIPCDDPVRAVEEAYAAGENDEFVSPRVIMQDGAPAACINDGDGVLFFNFRADRARQLTRALFDPEFSFFNRRKTPNLAAMVTMTRYEADFGLPVLFPPQHPERILGEVVSERGAHQLRIAETEKYAHVTYFFNGGREEPFKGEERILIPSPREVATYDQKPEMSVYEVTDNLCRAVESGRFDLIVCNLANLDMVGHSGIIPAAIRACEAVDECVGRITRAVGAAGGEILLTADHGNADDMLDEAGNPKTAHSLNRVPAVLVTDRKELALRTPGRLADVAPTILDRMGIPRPKEMTGQSLLGGE
jgi:2,3-bisphosphoglycerate-independent phosphoglycerate mutase